MPQPSKSLTLNINWKVTAFGLLLLPFLLRLGFWQLDRAEQKLQLQAEINKQKNLPVLLDVLESLNPVDINNRDVVLAGEFDQERYWLLDNRVRQGKVGYEVIVPYKLRSQEWLVVNLGWVQAPALRNELPIISLPRGDQKIYGHLHRPSINAMIDNSEQNVGWPKRIQQIDIELLQAQFEQDFIQPLLVRISATDNNAFAVEWRAVNSSRSKHIGYATQWFAMSFVLLLALIFANTNLGHVLGLRNTDG
jgi:surfeit locus 1 family protein